MPADFTPVATARPKPARALTCAWTVGSTPAMMLAVTGLFPSCTTTNRSGRRVCSVIASSVSRR